MEILLVEVDLCCPSDATFSEFLAVFHLEVGCYFGLLFLLGYDQSTDVSHNQENNQYHIDENALIQITTIKHSLLASA